MQWNTFLRGPRLLFQCLDALDYGGFQPKKTPHFFSTYYVDNVLSYVSYVYTQYIYIYRKREMDRRMYINLYFKHYIIIYITYYTYYTHIYIIYPLIFPLFHPSQLQDFPSTVSSFFQCSLNLRNPEILNFDREFAVSWCHKG